jgi:hypothetical protein
MAAALSPHMSNKRDHRRHRRADDRSRRHPCVVEQRASVPRRRPLLGMAVTFTAVRGAGFTGGHASAGRVTNLSERHVA